MGNSLTPQVPYMRYTNESDQQELTCCEVITNWWRCVPLITRFLIYTSTIISLIGIFFPIAYETLMNIPQFVYYSFEIWRIFTAPVANYGIIMLFFGLISYIPISMINENTKGSTKYMLYFITLSIISQIFLTLFDYTLQKLVTFPSISNGLWTMVMIEVTIDAIKEPNATRVFFCFPIPAIYLPFIYLLIFGLINPVCLLGLMCGCFTGLLYGLGLLSCLDPEEGCVNFANAYILFPFLSFSSFAKEFERPGNAPTRIGTKANKVTPFSGKGVIVGGGTSAGSQNNIRQPPQNPNQQPVEANIQPSLMPRQDLEVQRSFEPPAASS